MACDRAALAPYDVGVPRYTRQQVLRRRRIAALILAALVLIVFVSCTAGLVRLVSHGGEAEATAAAEPTVDTGTDALTIPRTATDASALSQLPSGESLRDGEVLGIDVSAHQGDIDWTTVITHMLTLQGIYGREMFETWFAMSAMTTTSPVLRDRVLATVTDVLPVTDFERAYDIARSGSGGKVLLDWEHLD